MMRRVVRCASTTLALAIVATACNPDSPFGDLGETLDAGIASSDTSLFLGTTATFVAVAQYGIGPGEPTSVAWGTDDTTTVRLVVSAVDRSVRVTAQDTGQAQLFAIINDTFRDSIQLEIIGPGEIRWRRALAGTPAFHPAVDDSGDVHVVAGDGTMRGYGPLGDTLYSADSCDGALGPSLDLRAPATTGTDCTRQHDRFGVVTWTAGSGNPDGGVAVAANGAVTVLAVEGGAGGAAVVLAQFAAADGQEVWRDTLVADTTVPVQQSAPAIATNGHIYVPWRSTPTAAHLSSYTAAGAHRWTIDLPGVPHRVTPAILADRVIVSYQGGLSVFNPDSTLRWSTTFTTDAPVSSSVADEDGILYVQTQDGLYSFEPDGSPRWTADSLGVSDASNGVGAPTLLIGGDLVVGCNSGAVCGVNAETGALRWRTTGLGVVGSPGIGPDGLIYVVSRSGELVALWGNRPSVFAGWPTEGGDQQRGRRRL